MKRLVISLTAVTLLFLALALLWLFAVPGFTLSRINARSVTVNRLNSILENEISEGNPNESFEYFSLNENYYDILSDCKSLLTEQKMDSIRIIFKEIED